MQNRILQLLVATWTLASILFVAVTPWPLTTGWLLLALIVVSGWWVLIRGWRHI